MLKTSIREADPKGQVTALLTHACPANISPFAQAHGKMIFFYTRCISLEHLTLTTDVSSVFETFWLGRSGAVSAATGESSRTA